MLLKAGTLVCLSVLVGLILFGGIAIVYLNISLYQGEIMVKRLFNEYGKLEDKDCIAISDEIDAMCASLFVKLLNDGVSPVEIRALSDYFYHSVSYASSNAILSNACNMRKRKKGEDNRK